MLTSYRAVPTQTSGDPNVNEPHYWQLAFVLSPARQWEGFGDLAVTVLVPAGWPAAVRPGLERRGNVLTGTFTGIPADSFGVTTRMPMPFDWTSAAWKSGLAAVLVLCVFAGWFYVRPTRWPRLLVVAPVLATVVAALVFASFVLRPLSVGGQSSWFGSKGFFFVEVGQSLLAWVEASMLGEVGLFIGIGAWASWRHRLKGRTSDQA
jgi:hypothetical protein